MFQYILLFTALLLCPIIDGLINNNNAIPIASHIRQATKFPLFNAHKVAEDAPNRSDGPAETSTTTPHGVWVPPSQNIKQRRGRIFRIEKPQDLLDFVIEDERLSVVKVYASWCKTCSVFDVRYRKLASQYSDDSIISNGRRVRFAEMQYDDPNNEEMCTLLNATKLPYILMYKGSRGKVHEFQCSPSKFKLLIEAVNEYADPVSSDGEMSNNNITAVNEENITAVDRNSLAAAANRESSLLSAAQDMNDDSEDDIDSLRQQLEQEAADKVEMFEIMKAQIEHDKEYITKLEAGVTTQRTLLEDKDSEITKLQSMLQSKEIHIQSLTDDSIQQQDQTKNVTEELSTNKDQLSQLTEKISQLESNISSIEQESYIKVETAQKRENKLLQQLEELEDQKNTYEKERKSLKHLLLLGVKCVVRGIKSLASSGRRQRSA